MDEVKEALKQKEIVFGSNSVLRKLKQGKLKKIIVAKNCKKEILESLERFSSLAKIEIVKLDVNNEQLAVVCKKPFNISCIGY